MAKIVIDARESGTGTGRYIDKLIQYLHELKPAHKITVLTKKHRMDFMKKAAPRFNVVECPYKEFTFAEQFGLWKQVHNLKPDLVHFGIVQQPVLYRGKVVTTMHDLTATRYRNPAKNRLIFVVKQWIYKWGNKIIARKSAAIITPTEFVKDDIAKFARINSRKITVTYEAADIITETAESVDGLEDAPFIMYVGRPQAHKNLERLIDAFAILKQTHPELKLVLAGKKDVLYERHENSVKKKHIPDVIFTGFVSEGQLRWLYEQTKAYVFPSLSEGFGLPGLEAMTHGAPVISSDATCLPELYGDAALYFDPTDIDDVATKINEVLLNSPLRNKLIEAGYRQAKKYSWKKMAAQTLDVYDKALNLK